VINSDSYFKLLVASKKDSDLYAFVVKMLETETERHELTLKVKQAWDKVGVSA
jgi:hypothetical protein